jgi:hypothetical protein
LADVMPERGKNGVGFWHDSKSMPDPPEYPWTMSQELVKITALKSSRAQSFTPLLRPLRMAAGGEVNIEGRNEESLRREKVKWGGPAESAPTGRGNQPCG